MGTNLVDNDRAFETGICGNLTHGLLKHSDNDFGAGFFVALEGVAESLNCGNGVHKSHAAAGNNALFNGCLGCRESILDSELLILHFNLGGRADLDNGYAARKLGKTLLKLFTVEIGGSAFDLIADLTDTVFNGGLLSRTVHNDGVFLGNRDLTGGTELCNGGVLKVETKLLGDDFAAGEYGDVAEHFLSSVAETGSLNANAGEGSAELVDENGGKSLALNVLGDDEQFLAGLYDLLEQGQDVLNVADLFIGDENVGLVKLCNHFVGIGDHVGEIYPRSNSMPSTTSL